MYTDNEALRRLILRQRVLAAAHRGVKGGNVLQNTCLAYENALLHGADLVEVDAAMTKDGVFYAFHDGEEPYVLGVQENIRTMDSRRAESLELINSLNLPSGQRLERVEAVFDFLRGKCFINVDRAWFYWEEIIRLILKCGMEDQVILKSAPEPQYLEMMEKIGNGIMYMPILHEMEEWEQVKQYDVNVAAAELIFKDLDSPFLSAGFMKEMHGAGIAPWVNSLTLDGEVRLSGGLDDNRAIAMGCEAVWGKLADYGFEIIQTDWPALLKGWAGSRGW